MSLRPSKPLITFSLTCLAVAALALAAGCSDDGSATPPDAGLPDQLIAADLTADAPAGDPELRELTSMMTGTFDTKQQSETDPTYYNVSLTLKHVWPERDPGTYWLYVEQAIVGAPPYRQRVYQLERVDATTLVSKVYDFIKGTDRAKAVGAWEHQTPLSTMSPQDLTLKTGCGVLLVKQSDGSFLGATDAKKCLSDHQGATYATSDVKVTTTRLTSWDRGYDAQDQQVWGAITGPYLFDKQQDLDPELAP